jgi:sec-independent protein translocase protein TatA
MPGWIGMPELIVLLIALLLIFGPKRLPEMGRSLGRGMREFKDSINSKVGDDLDALPVVTEAVSAPTRSEERTQ